MRAQLLAVSSLAALLTGCANPGAVVQYPAIPAAEGETLRFRVVTENKNNLAENVVQTKNHPIPMGSSVVISVPDSKVQKKSEAEGSEYRTDGFFSAAEQQIERSLLKNGFQVKDRSKFEAILRDLRDQRQKSPNYWNDYNERDFAPEMRPLRAILEEQLKKKEIDIVEYGRQMEALSAKYRIGAASQRRKEDEKELTDISEVVRAASASEIQADYILQIHEFETLRMREDRINLFKFAPVRDLMSRYPRLEPHFTQKQFYPCQSLSAGLNAKLIHVKTGNVVWIGNHSVSELDSAETSMELEFTPRRLVSNAAKVKEFVDYQNLPHVREKRGDVVQLPAWEYREELIGPTHVAGASCTVGRRSSDDVAATRTQLSRRVASDLMSTIQVGSAP